MGVILFIYEKDPYGKNKKIETLLQRMPAGYIVKQVESGEEGYNELERILAECGRQIKKVVVSLTIKATLDVRKWTTIIVARASAFTETTIEWVEFSIH